MMLEFDKAKLTKLTMGLAGAGVVADTYATKEVKKAIENTKKYAKILVPKDTRILRDNIKTSYEDGGYTGICYVDHSNAFYGFWVENGTKKMGARPYLMPSFERYSKQFSKDLVSAWAKNLFQF